MPTPWSRGEPQAVLVHVDSGTMNLGGVVANAARGRAPVLILAGSAPFTIEGELPGSRNEFIHWIQDVHDQRGILRNYTKYDNEIRTGRNVKQIVHRALQIARSEPAGPVYLVGPREVMEETLEPQTADPARYTPIAPGALDPDVVAEIGGALAAAQRPLVITSYLGRNPAAVDELVRFCELLAVPVIEAAASHVNFPSDHYLHWGYEWTPGQQNQLLAEADTILVVDTDVPWIHTTSRPSADAEIYCIDIDPLKYQMPMWHIPARRFAAASSRVALRQLHDFVLGSGLADPAAVAARRAAATAVHDEQRAAWAEREQVRDAVITPAYLTACIRDALEGQDALILAEPVTNLKTVAEHLRLQPAGLADQQRRQRARFRRRRRRRRQARRTRPDRRLPRRRRQLPFRRALLRALGGAALRHADPHRDLRQPGLASPQAVRARHPSGRSGRRWGRLQREFRARSRPAGNRRRGGRRVRPDRHGSRRAAAGAQGGARRGPRRQVGRAQRPPASGLTRRSRRTGPDRPGPAARGQDAQPLYLTTRVGAAPIAGLQGSAEGRLTPVVGDACVLAAARRCTAAHVSGRGRAPATHGRPEALPHSLAATRLDTVMTRPWGGAGPRRPPART